MPPDETNETPTFNPATVTATQAPTTPAPMPRTVRIPDGVPVTDVTVIVGYKDSHGVRQEVIHDITDRRILKFNLSSEAKVEKVKVEGQIVDFAPTGEVHLKLEMKYLEV